MNRSYPVWENAAPPQPGPALTFHRWRNNLMRFIPILGFPTLLMSLIMISDLSLLVVQAIAEGLAIIYTVPSIIISQQDGDSAFDMVLAEALVACTVGGLWMGSVIRLAHLRGEWRRTCSDPYDRLLHINFGRSDVQCTFSIITIITSSLLLAACVLWFLILLLAMRMTPGKQFGQTWRMSTHRLARGNEVGTVDLYEGTEAQREINEYHRTIQPFTGGLQDARRQSQRQSARIVEIHDVVSRTDEDEAPPAYRSTAGTTMPDWASERGGSNVVRQL